jgi:hypothetical protein
MILNKRPHIICNLDAALLENKIFRPFSSSRIRRQCQVARFLLSAQCIICPEVRKGPGDSGNFPSLIRQKYVIYCDQFSWFRSGKRCRGTWSSVCPNADYDIGVIPVIVYDAKVVEIQRSCIRVLFWHGMYPLFLSEVLIFCGWFLCC